MSELLQQFLIESRELIESASDQLAILEQSPEDKEHLDAVLRSLHTLKGGAGIVSFRAMERSLHAAEDLLSAARSDPPGLSAGQLSRCLACLERALEWLEIIEQTGQLPQDADRQADQIVDGLREALTLPATGHESDQISASWLGQLIHRHPEVSERALSAVRFVPAEEGFYQSEDPLARMLSLPALLALDCIANSAWGPLESLDPFRCNLTLMALSAAPIADLVTHLKGHTGECDIMAAASGQVGGQLQTLPTAVVAVIRAQRALLGATTPEDFVGRVGSAGLVAANALRSCGRLARADSLSGATARSIDERSAQPLKQALDELVSAAPLAAATDTSATPTPSTAGRTVRVDAERVDALVRVLGELTVVKNALAHIAKLAQAGDPSVPALLKDRHASLEHLIDELQNSVLALRVRPLRTVLKRFPRLVREIAATLGKSVGLNIEGAATEADKAIVEMLPEPLLHLVRNAIDHGIERPEVRAAKGKPPVASLRISARRVAAQVLVEVSDDGAGVDVARVADIASARGVVTSEQLRTMSETDIIDLIFAPGFSTASEVTRVSGRGIGMDAVRRAVEQVGGTVTIVSRAGHGATVRLLLPFSVMMTQVMTFEASGQMFGLPLDTIIETVRVPKSAISQIGSAQAVVLHDRTVPLVDLATLMGAEPTGLKETEATVVVVAAYGEWGAIQVDRVEERLELVLKPLDGLLSGIPGIAGTTLLGDGRVLLVLDIGEMLL